MFAIGQPAQDTPPTIGQYIFYSLFGLVFAFMAVSMIVALFSDRQRSKVHWGRGRGRRPMTRLSILMALPFVLLVPVRFIVYFIATATGHEKTWAVPYWWFFPCVALFLLGALYDRMKA